MPHIMPDIDEALRYLGVREPDEDTRARMRRVAVELAQILAPRYALREASLMRTEDGWHLPEANVTLRGNTADRMLQTSRHAVLLVCTLGVRFDALLRQWQARDMAQAAMLDACGSAYVEAGCDAAEKAVAQAHPGLYLTDRFSPGYGDLPLELQPGILAATDAQRRLGVTVSESRLMNPAKTVTAVIGLSDEPQRARIRGCAYCSLRKQCTLRKKGESCEP